ncbi:MAG: transposase [Lachnospiraceae bacterium]|nr:transposase [Lachnospiraceae bacterium]
MENRVYKYRIYPNAKQRDIIKKTFGSCRFIWNKMLTDKIEHYKITGKNITTRPAMYKEMYPFLKEVDSLALTNVQINLQNAYNNYFKNKRTGFPKFKTKEKDNKRYTTNNQKGTIKVFDEYIRLPILGLVAGKIHRRAPKEWTLKSATITEDNGKYYCSVLYEYEKEEENSEIGLDESIGIVIDVRESCFTSEGAIFSISKSHEKEERLIKLEEKIKMKSSGSNNRKRLKNDLDNMKRKIYNQNQDYIHKKTTELTRQYKAIYIIKPKNIHEHRTRVEKNINKFISMLTYKQTDAGGTVYVLEDEKIYKNTYDLLNNSEENGKIAAIYLKEKGYLMMKAEQEYIRAISSIPE